ncbi:MAG TPA: glycosyltransferase [Methylomirabilota bacterium]|nr:glycosyltransferase [Methylomirabilota bacterium]
MRILHTIRSVNPEGGGVIETIKQFSRVLERQGHDVTIASLDTPSDQWVKDCSHHVEALGSSSGAGVPPANRASAVPAEPLRADETSPARCQPGRLPHYGYSPRFVPWLRDNAEKFDAIVVNGIWQFNSFGVWKALRGTGKSYFVFPHGMLDPWFKRTYPLKHAKKWLYWPWAEYRVLRDADSVLFTCDEERRLARESFWLYRCNERIVTLGIARPPGDADAQREFFLSKFPECRGKRTVLFLGRIHEKKGCDLLIRAFSEVSRAHADLHLVMAGPEQQNRAEWRGLASDLRVGERITWTGMLDGDLKWGALRAAEVFALPSHQENFGIAVVEALACGVPALISREVNIWREIVESGAGFAEADTVEGTAQSLRHWLAMTPPQQEQMRASAVRCFAERFEINRAADHLLAVLQKNGNGGAQ